MSFLSFHLSEEFINGYRDREPNWGFDIGGGNSLGELTYVTKYARLKDDGTKEHWYETCRRCVEGMYDLQKRHCQHYHTPWNELKAQHSAQDAYDRMFQFKWTPPGRGLANMGTRLVHEERNAAPLYNCAACSTESLSPRSVREATLPFVRAMEMSAYGIGVGFDTRGRGKLTLHEPASETEVFVVPDSREGWAESVAELLATFFFKNRKTLIFDYSQVRPQGAPLKRFGGTASGPEPLRKLHEGLRTQLSDRDDEKLTSRDIVDIMNRIGKAIQAGGARRSAMLSLGEADDDDYINLKNWDLPQNAERTGDDGWAWTSNNSVHAISDTDLSHLVDKIAVNGEPGIIWVDMLQQYGRIADGKDFGDPRANLTNPCQPGWATVLTRQGLSTIEWIRVGDEIWSSEGWTTVTKKWSTGTKSVYRYRTSAGVFYGTENHRLVSGGEKVEAVEADSIDRLRGPGPYCYDHDPQIVMDGLVVGDGSVHRASNDLVYLCVGAKDLDYFDSEVTKLLTLERPGLSRYAWEVVTSIAAEELPRVWDRCIPHRFMYATPNQVASLLRGLYSANGSVIKDSRVALKATSRTLVEQVQILLSSLGIGSYLTTNRPTETEHRNGVFESRESYDVNISSKDILSFADAIGFIQGYKQEALEVACARQKGKSRDTYDIREIDFVAYDEVFDLTVDNASHTYWTGGVNVSNCGEIPLEGNSFEVCNLAELYPTNHDSYEDFVRSMKYAYLYAKSVTLIATPWPETNEVVARNRRIGISVTGVAEYVETRGWFQLRDWLDNGYKTLKELDKSYSSWLGIRESIRLSTAKPAGSTSLIGYTTPGVHWPTTSDFFLRRQRFLKTDPVCRLLREAGYNVEPDRMDPDQTVVVEMPTRGIAIRNEQQVSVWEKALLASGIQEYWADNAVSVTVSFDKDSEYEQITPLLRSLQGRLKTVSFLPIDAKGTSYDQAPYEPLDELTAMQMMQTVKPLDRDRLYGQGARQAEGEQYCSTDRCEIPL